MNREPLNIKDALLNALIGSVPIIFFIGVTAFAVECSSGNNPAFNQPTDNTEE